MSYIKLKVRSGGIYIRQKKDYGTIDLDLTPHSQDSSQKVLSLVRESSIKGLFSYLMGETKKLKDIEESTDSSVQKFNSTLKTILQTVAYKKKSEPHITTFFERRDVHIEDSKVKYEPNVNLEQHTIQTGSLIIKLLEKPLEKLFKTNSLGKINEIIKKVKLIQQI